MVVAELADDRRQSELFHGGHLRGNGAEGGADAGLFSKYVDSEAAALGRYVREIDVVAVSQLLLLVLGQHFRDIALEFRLTQVAKLDGHEIPVHTQHRGHPHGQMQIRAALSHA